jgi:hypothetical protein
MKIMAKNITIQVNVGVCSTPSSLPDMDLSADYVALVMFSDDVRLAGENYATNGVFGFRAGIVFVDVDILARSLDNRQSLATFFETNVKTCHQDGVCTANELVSWVPTGTNWILASSDNRVRILSESSRS